jgi:hypothetical protein
MKKRCVLSDGSRLRRDAAYALQKSQRVGHPEGLPERLKEAGADKRMEHQLEEDERKK